MPDCSEAVLGRFELRWSVPSVRSLGEFNLPFSDTSPRRPTLAPGGAEMPNQQDVADWLRRVEAEYREMPGLHLTEAQMRRLWGLDDDTCALLIAALLESGVLHVTPKRGYVLAAASQH